MSTHLRLYRALTRMAPRAHRDRFRDEQCTLFADLLAHGVPARTLWRHALPDLVRVWGTTPRGSLTAFAGHLAAGAATAGAASAAALAPSGATPVTATPPDVARARSFVLARLAARPRTTGHDLSAAAAAQVPPIGRDAVWRALVDLQDARMIADDPAWGWAPVDYRMRARYHLTAAGLAAVADGAPDHDGTTVTPDTPS